MWGFLPITFRFRGKVRLLLDIYYCFVDLDKAALHPTQIARHTGLSFAEVAARLDATPELFVKLPKRDGLTRYRLTSATAARSDEDVETLVHRGARRESWILYAFGTMVACLLLIVAIVVAPTF